MVGKIWVMDTT
jgi:hypothetical protein